MTRIKKLEGTKIYLSPMSLEDAEAFSKWISDRSVSDNTHSTSKIYNIETEKEWIKNILENKEPTFSIVLQENDELIGNCGLMNIKQIDGTAEIGIMIGEEENRNKGYGSEAIRLLLEFGFDVLKLHNIDLRVFDFNKRAIACYKKLGFKEYGIKHECYYLNGKYHNEILLEMLEKDYRVTKNGDV